MSKINYKTFILIFNFIFCSASYAQWTDFKGESVFNGSYQSIKIKGVGEYPFKQPTMEYILWGNGGGIFNNDSYLSIEGIGYTGCDKNYIEISLNGEIYKLGAYLGNNVISNSNNDGLIIKTGVLFRNANGKEKISICDLVSKSFNNGPLYLKVTNSCSSKTFVFNNSDYNGNAELIYRCDNVHKRHRKQLNILFTSFTAYMVILGPIIYLVSS